MEGRLARLEALVEAHEGRLRELACSLARVNEELGEVRAQLARIEERLDGLGRRLEENNKRSMWRASLVVGALAALGGALIQALLGL